MSELVHQLGIDWKLLVAQGVNFFVLLVVLTVFVYRPLVRLMEERRKKIEFGLKGAEEAEKRLGEIEEIKTKKIAEADKEAVGIIGSAEKKAGLRVTEILAEADKKASSILVEAEKTSEHKKQEELEKLAKEANSLIKEAIIKTVELDSRAIDESLIAKVAATIKNRKL